MCRVLKISRSRLYYKPEHKTKDKSLNVRIKNIFIKNRKVFGTRKIKVKLQKSGYVASRRLIGRIIKEEALVSAYTKVQFKPYKDTYNESKVANILDRKFSGQPTHSVTVNDLT